MFQMKNKNFDTDSAIVLILLLALVSPLLLLPLEKILPYPYIIEELLKAAFVLAIIHLPKKATQIKTVLLAAFLFALSENIFYLANFIDGQFISAFGKRFLLTAVLHILTAMIIFFPAQKKRALIVPGLLLAMLIHYFYNQLILTIF